MRRGVGKYGVAPKAARTARDGTVFDSKAELIRWEKLRLWQLAGHVKNLRRQVKFDLVINGEKVGVYTADFVYDKYHEQPGSPGHVVCGWIEVIEDVKGVMTKDAALRIRVFEAIHNKKVHIVRG